jgi:hypothetical protein
MGAAIKLVAGDTLPYVKLALVNADGSVLNVAGAIVNILFRVAGTSPVLSTIVCAQPNGGSDGVVTFNFPAPTLTVAAGNYEGAVQIFFGPDRQTLYSTIPFLVRAAF